MPVAAPAAWNWNSGNAMKQVEDVEWAITLRVPCTHCGQEALQAAAKLVDREEVPCRSCGTAIDLTSQAWKAFLNEFSDSIEVLRPLYARLP
jgi:hypothetical protein